MFRDIGIVIKNRLETNAVINKGSNKKLQEEKWFRFETNDRHHKIKYKHNSTVRHPDWSNTNLKKMMENMKTKIYDKLIRNNQ